MARNNVYVTLIGKLEKLLSTQNPGTLLPPEQALADQYGVSKPTLRRALAELARRGIIHKQNGVGSVVSENTCVISKELIFLCHDVVFFADSLKSFSRKIADANYLGSILPLCGDAAAQERIISTAIARAPAGIVIYADPRMKILDGYRRLAECGIPLLFLTRLPHGVKGNLLTFENADGIVGIVRRFYEEGCRHFALYAGENINPLASEERTAGFLAGLRKCRLKARPEFLCGKDGTPEERETFYDLFRDPAKAPDAVCCLNDTCAGEFIRAMRKRGISIDGIRLSGFDHLPLTAFLPHDLLTVEPPMDELGLVAADMLIRRIENPEFAFVTRKLASKLITVNPVE